MPHYKCGTEAKIGDVVFGPTHHQISPVAGTVVKISPSSDTCNMIVAALVHRDIASKTHSYQGSLTAYRSGQEGDPLVLMEPVFALANCKDHSLLHRNPETPVS